MKRIFCLAMVMLLAFSLFSACGNASSSSESTAPAESSEPTEGVKKPAMNIYQKSDPTQDNVFNILMIGNSHCYYYADELYSIAAAAGIKVRVSNVYHSGCIIKQHYQWWKEGLGNYTFITHDENGRTAVEGATLEYCLKQANWDVISLQSGTTDFAAKPPEQVISETREMRKELWEHIKTQFPMSKYYWHHSWSFQVGANKFGIQYDEPSKQHELDQKLATIAKQVCSEDNLLRVPTGPAWRIVRDGGYDDLCSRIGVTGDYGHDGDVGGGQYLNACVWFETLLGQSCIGNTWRPDYNLSEDMIAMLQKAAHDAVAQMKAEDGV